MRKRAMERVAPTVRSAERWGSRLSRRRVGRSGPGGRSGQQKRGAADEDSLDRKTRGQCRHDQEREFQAHRDRVGQPWVPVILGTMRWFDFEAGAEAPWHRRRVGPTAMVLGVVRSFLVQPVVRVAVCEHQTGAGEAHQHGNRKSDSAREWRPGHAVNVGEDPEFGENVERSRDHILAARERRSWIS